MKVSKIAVAFAILFLWVHTAAAQQRLIVSTDPRIELISVLEVLAPRGFAGLLATDDTAYRRDVISWFGEYKTHPAVLRLAELAANGYDHDAPMATAICLSMPPELTLEAKAQDCAASRAGGPESLRAWVDQLRDFAGKSDFLTFYRAHAGLYSMMEQSARSRIPRDYAADLESYFGTHQSSYHIVLAPLLAGGNYGPSRRRDDGTLDLYGVVSSTGQSRGVAQFGAVEDLRYQVWHEFAHSFVNPEITSRSAEVERSAKLMAPIAAAMKSQAYDQWTIAVYEHIVRAVTVRLTFRELGDEEGKAELLYEKSRGFAYVEALADSLKQYEQERNRYPAFHEYVPRLLAVLENLSKRDLPKEYFEAPYTGTFASANRVSGPTVLIVPTGESDAEAQTGILEYIRKVQSQFFAGSEIITDEQALARDLSASRIFAYGTLAGNKWLARYGKSIPALAALERRTEPGPLRLIATMPNPQDPKRGVTVYAATAASAVIGIHNLFHNDNWAYVAGKDQTVLTSGAYAQKDGKWLMK